MSHLFDNVVARLFGFRCIATLIIVIGAGLGASPLAFADDLAVAGGQDLEVAIDVKPIVVTKAPVRGLAKVTNPTGTNNTLTYSAPLVDTETSETIEYKVGDAAAVTKTVRVTPTTPLLSGGAMAASAKVLAALLVLAIILENALALLFNWRPFLELLNRKAVQPLVAFGVAYLFVRQFNFDATSALFTAYEGRTVSGGTIGLVVTAMVIAGGSSGVNRMLQSLGFRLPSATIDAKPTPPPTLGWIAVTLYRKKAIGPVHVISQFVSPTGQPGEAEVIGTITGSSIAGGTGLLGLLKRFARFFLRADGRFPSIGGASVAPGTYKVWLEGRGDKEILRTDPAWGPYAIAAGSLIDITLEL
jgi:hypothetical protein